MDQDWTALGRAVVGWRTELGYRSQEELAAAAGVGIKTVSRLETGNKVSDRILHILAKVLDRSFDEMQDILLGGEPAEARTTEEGTEPVDLTRADRWEILDGLTQVAAFGEAAFSAALIEAAESRKQGRMGDGAAHQSG